MTDLTREQVQERAEAIAAELKARGIPVIGAMEMDCGHRIGVAFQLENERAKYGVRGPVEATADWFEAMYRAVA